MLYYIFKFISNSQYIYYLLIYYYTLTILYNSINISLYLINNFTYFPSFIYNFIYKSSTYLYYYNNYNKNIDNNNNNDNNINNKKITILLNNYDNQDKFILL